MNLRGHAQAPSSHFREEVVSRRTKFLLEQGARPRACPGRPRHRRRQHRRGDPLIRAAPDPATAREQLMARDWPAEDVAPLIALIDDPRHRINDGRHLSPVRRAGPRHPRPAPAAPDGARPRRDRRRTERARRARSPTISTSCARARASVGIVKDELTAIRDEFATPRRTEIVESDGEIEDEDLIAARGHGRHRHPRGLHQARAALAPTGRSGAAARAAPAWRPATRISSPACSSPTRTRRCCSSPRAAGLQDEGLAAAARRAAGARQGADQPAAARAGRAHHHHPAAARGRGELGASSTSCSPPRRAACAATSCPTSSQVNRNGKIAMKLDEGDEHRRRRDLHGAATTCC